MTDWIADFFPIPSDDLPTCGNRKDLFKKQRVHDYVYMGRDVRHGGEKGWMIEMDVYACIKCGRDMPKKIKDKLCHAYHTTNSNVIRSRQRKRNQKPQCQGKRSLSSPLLSRLCSSGSSQRSQLSS